MKNVFAFLRYLRDPLLEYEFNPLFQGRNLRYAICCAMAAIVCFSRFHLKTAAPGHVPAMD